MSRYVCICRTCYTCGETGDDPSDELCDWCMAGHPPSLLTRALDRVAELFRGRVA